MNQRRTLILVAAIAIGALGSFLVWNYVNGVEDDAFKDAEQVQVYLVKTAIPRGTDGTTAQTYIAAEKIPMKFKPSNAITDPQDISGKVAVSDMVPNQVVVSDLFVDASDPAARVSFAERLDRIRNEDQVAITISVDQVRGVAGLVRPGDFVNIMISKVKEVDAQGNPVGVPEGGNPEDFLFSAQARYLYQKVEVLAVGQDAVPQPGATAAEAGASTGTSNSGLITLIVPTKAAQYIASVAPENIYLVLVARDYKPVPQENIDINAALPAENSAQLTPYGTEGPDAGE